MFLLLKTKPPNPSGMRVQKGKNNKSIKIKSLDVLRIREIKEKRLTEVDNMARGEKKNTKLGPLTWSFSLFFFFLSVHPLFFFFCLFNILYCTVRVGGIYIYMYVEREREGGSEREYQKKQLGSGLAPVDTLTPCIYVCCYSPRAGETSYSVYIYTAPAAGMVVVVVPPLW